MLLIITSDPQMLFGLSYLIGTALKFKMFKYTYHDTSSAFLGWQKVNALVRELNGYNLNGSNIRVQMSTLGVRQ